MRGTMKVGDLVKMLWRNDNITGIVLKVPYIGSSEEKQQEPRIGVMWSDDITKMNWEITSWLEVINEVGS